MIQIIAWIGAITGFIGGFGMLFLPAPAETRHRIRRQGIISLVAGTICVLLLATRLI
jgi:hypothetical protein